MDRELREHRLINAAVTAAYRQGLADITPADVARESGMSLRTVYRWCGKRNQLRKIVAEHARARGFRALIDEARQLSI